MMTNFYPPSPTMRNNASSIITASHAQSPPMDIWVDLCIPQTRMLP